MSYLKPVYPISVEELDKMGFFTAPASTKYHGAYEGGLFDHSLEVAKQLVELTNRLGLTWETPGSPYIVGMFHDLCKVDNYVEINTLEEVAPINIKYKYNPSSIIPGHGEKSVIMLQKHIKLTDEEIACIRWHMGAYETDTKLWEYYGRAIETYPNVLYTHTADMIASKIVGV
jgi:hypothetical protein